MNRNKALPATLLREKRWMIWVEEDGRRREVFTFCMRIAVAPALVIGGLAVRCADFGTIIAIAGLFRAAGTYKAITDAC